MNHADTKFPDELMERCKVFSGEVTGTRAVRVSLQRLFELEQKYRSLKLKYKDLQSDFDELYRAVRVLRNFQAGKFRLHGD